MILNEDGGQEAGQTGVENDLDAAEGVGMGSEQIVAPEVTDGRGAGILPSGGGAGALVRTVAITELICDEHALPRLLERMMKTGGVGVQEIARQWGVNSEAIRQYVKGRRSKPGLAWFVRFAASCGATITMDLKTPGPGRWK